MSEREGTRLVVASYNVHGWTGADGRADPGRIREVIRELDADVIALQEVACEADRDDALDVLAGALGHRVLRGPTLEWQRGSYGNALLTRLRVVEVSRLDLSVPGREPRGALVVEVDPGAERLCVVTTHLGLRLRERHLQIRRLGAAIDAVRAPVVVVLGDMNEWIRGAGSLRPLHRRLGRAPALRTFPAVRPLLALDRIWVRPRRCVRRISAHRSPLARVASDHLPVRAELRLDAGCDPATPSGVSRRDPRGAGLPVSSR